MRITGRRRGLGAAALAAGALLAAAGAAGAQSVSGRVTDAYGHAVPGATVRVVGTTAGTRADGDGEWALHLPAGAHALEISRAGLRTQRRTVQVRAGGTARLDAVLDAGGVSEEVQIDSAEAFDDADGWDEGGSDGGGEDGEGWDDEADED